MEKFILGKKIEMTQIFEGEKVIPVTLIKAGPCFITQIKTKDKDGYQAVQIAFDEIKKLGKAVLGQMRGLGKFRYLKEFRAKQPAENSFKVGDKIDVSVFQIGDKVSVIGVSKGKGFQGGVKRWGFSGRNATHGVKHEHRTIGSVGMRFPQRVIKGRRMPGRMGVERVTIKNLKIIKIDKENNLFAIEGAVPGARGTLLEIKTEK
ncbi:MAG: 50S ribosomal protein L3 [bacterium]|nr:50S ribosomal protein L3 [bacterium]